jgi:hypothetical protein
MITIALASLLLVGPSVDSTTREAPPLKIWISNDRAFRPGQAVKVQIETGKPGYLLVLHFSPSGQLSVAFPLAPGDDNLVQADRRYEVRQGDGSVSFVASGSGPGLVYSAISDDPWQLESVNLNGAWDYGALTIARDTKDPEADITALVQKLSSPRGFDYDVLDYAVFGERGADASPPPSWWSPAYGEGYYDGCACGGVYGPSIYVGFGFNWGYAGWPWYWGFSYASPYSYYGYYPGGGYYPYYPHYPYYPYYPHGGGYYGSNRIVGRPRGYAVNPAYPNGRGRGGSRSVVTSGEGVFADGNGPARRARGGDRVGTRGGESRGGGVGRPTGNEGSRGTGAGASSGNPRSNGGDRGDRARPREGGDRARSNGRSGSVSASAPAPNIEQARPSSRARGQWLRVDDMTPARPVSRSATPVRVDGAPTRVDVPQARRTYRPEAPRTREAFAARPSTDARPAREGQGRASGGNQGQAREQPQARAVPRTEARGNGGNRSGGTPSYAAPRGNSQPRFNGGNGGGGSRGGAHGGGGRARGRP